MNDSVDSDALVIPSSSGRPWAGRPPSAMTRSFSSRNRNLSTCSSTRNSVSPTSSIFDPAHHLADDHLDVLVVDVDALQPVDLLNLVDQVALQRLLAEHVEDVVRVARPVHQRLAGAHPLALLDVDVDAARQRVLPRLGTRLVRDDDDLPLALDDAAVLDDAVDLG